MRWLRRLLVQRYATPNLHEGRWGPVEVRRGIVTWHRVDDGWLRDYVGPHDCGAAICRIGPGMSHVDECMCGKKRYGVFGAWS